VGVTVMLPDATGCTAQGGVEQDESVTLLMAIEDALVVVQDNATVWPAMMMEGDAFSVTVGAGPAGTTVTVA